MELLKQVVGLLLLAIMYFVAVASLTVLTAYTVKVVQFFWERAY